MQKDYGLGISYRWLREYGVIFQRSEEQRNTHTYMKRVSDGPEMGAVGEGGREVKSSNGVTTRAPKCGHRLDQSPGSFLLTVHPPGHIAKYAPAKMNASRSRQHNNEMSVIPLQHGEAPVIKFSGQSPHLQLPISCLATWDAAGRTA